MNISIFLFTILILVSAILGAVFGIASYIYGKQIEKEYRK